MSDKKVPVKAHERSTPSKEAEERFVLEFPSVAPKDGVKIIDAKKKVLPHDARGVRRLGGGDHGKTDKGVKRLGY